MNLVFAEDTTAFTAFIYRNNVIKTTYTNDYKLQTWNYLNWSTFTGSFLLDENWKIIHTLVPEILNWKKQFKLDNTILDIENADRVIFLENGSYIVAESNPPKWKNNFIILDGKKIFEWTNDEFDKAISKYFIRTNTSGSDKQYFFNEKGELIPFVKGRMGIWYFIDKNKANLVYDVVCKDNALSFFLDWKEVIHSSWAKQFFFPTKRIFWIDTLLNINGKQYLLTDDDIWFDKCTIWISSNPKLESREIKNLEIIKDVENIKLAKNVSSEEIIRMPSIIEVKNVWGQKIYYQIDWKISKIFFDNKVIAFLNTEEFLIWKNNFVVLNEEKWVYDLYLNGESVYKWDKNWLDNILKRNQEGTRNSFTLNYKWTTDTLWVTNYEMHDGSTKNGVTLNEYLDLLKNSEEVQQNSEAKEDPTSSTNSKIQELSEKQELAIQKVVQIINKKWPNYKKKILAQLSTMKNKIWANRMAIYDRLVYLLSNDGNNSSVTTPNKRKNVPSVKK